MQPALPAQQLYSHMCQRPLHVLPFVFVKYLGTYFVMIKPHSHLQQMRNGLCSG